MSYFVFVLIISKIPMTIVPTTGCDLPLGLKLPSLRCCIPTNQPTTNNQPLDTNQPTNNHPTNDNPTNHYQPPTNNQPLVTNHQSTNKLHIFPFPTICIEQYAHCCTIFPPGGISCNLTCNNFCTYVAPM